VQVDEKPNDLQYLQQVCLGAMWTATSELFWFQIGPSDFLLFSEVAAPLGGPFLVQQLTKLAVAQHPSHARARVQWALAELSHWFSAARVSSRLMSSSRPHPELGRFSHRPEYSRRQNTPHHSLSVSAVASVAPPSTTLTFCCSFESGSTNISTPAGRGLRELSPPRPQPLEALFRCRLSYISSTPPNPLKYVLRRRPRDHTPIHHRACAVETRISRLTNCV
jgi:hypothetical protein